jgi:hypothetical protein
MAKSDSDENAAPAGVPGAESAPVKAELPVVESPSISPAGPLTEPELEPAAAPILELEKPVEAQAPAETIAASPLAETAAPAGLFASLPRISLDLPRMTIRPRHKRHALLAASVAVAGALGAIVGATATGGFKSEPPRADIAGAERQAMQQSLDKLSKEVVALKSNLDTANKTARNQIAKIDEKFTEKFSRASADEVTGSISAPQTVAAPLPTPRPAQRPASELRPQVVQDWAIRDTRDGYVYVQSHGDVYQVVPGAPLPGLGPVQSIKQQDGRWVVTTPRGIIVSMRDRRYFE